MSPKHRQCRAGTAIVEFAVVLPVLAGLFLGMCEVGSALNATIVLQDAATYGGRLASIGESTNTQVKQSVLTSLKVAGIPTTNAAVTVSDLTHTGIDAHEATTLDKLQVVVSVPFKDVKWGVSGFIIHDSTLLTAKAVFYSARVNPYPTDISMPDGF
jgi:Flp pilus assembly protein TadG